MARQLHSISLVPRPQLVDTQPWTKSSFAAITNMFRNYSARGYGVLRWWRDFGCGINSTETRLLDALMREIDLDFE